MRAFSRHPAPPIAMLTLAAMLVTIAPGSGAESSDPRATTQSKRQETIQAITRLGARVIVDPKSERVIEINLNDNPSLRDGDLHHLTLITRLTDLSLEGTQIGDAGLEHLKKMKRLEWLNLYRSKVGDEGVKHLTEIKTLKHLPIGKTRVTDDGLEHIGKMDQLVYLGLRSNAVSNAGLKHLAGTDKPHRPSPWRNPDHRRRSCPPGRLEEAAETLAPRRQNHQRRRG